VIFPSRTRPHHHGTHRTCRSDLRATEGCLDFVQSADPIDPTRVNIFERWTAEEPMVAFREMDHQELPLPPIVGADVKRYVIASIEAP